MLKRLPAFLLTLALAIGALVASEPAQAATASAKEGSDLAAPLFDPLAISQVSLVHRQGYPNLTQGYLDSEEFRHANITITLPGKPAVTVNDVGVRLKGQASRYDDKFPMKIKFDAFVPGQKFLGLKRMTLNNMVQDPSFIHEVTAYRMYRAAGVPAPRAGYSKVFVEGTSMGLYLNLESVDKVFAARWYPSTAHIYAGPYNCDILPGNTCYEATIGDTDRSDLYTAGNVSLLQGEEWWNAINQVADMPRVIKLMATDIFLSNWDGYSDAVQNNHFTHFDDQGRLTIIPWGLDQTFTSDPWANLTWDASGPIYRNWSDHRSTLLDHCIAYAPCHSEIIREGVRISALATSINLLKYMNDIAARINPVVTTVGEKKQTDLYTLFVYQGWVDSFIPQRQQVLTNFLASKPARAIKVSIPQTIRVGQSVKATIQTLWEPGVTISYQWQLNGVDLPGQTALTYKVASSEFAETLTLRVLLQKSGRQATVVDSNESGVLGRLFTKSPTPAISGTVTKGKTIKVSSGTWDSGTAKTYQWLRNSQPILGATSSSYRVGSFDVGAQLSVRVTGTKAGYSDTSRTSRKSSRVR